MKVKVHTQSGSTYILDKIQMTWDRERSTPDAELTHPVRTKGGTIDNWPKLVVGQSMFLVGPPIVEGTTGRAIVTSPVVEVETQ